MRTLPLILILLMFAPRLYAEQTLARIDKIKAAYLINFTKFISWQDRDQEALTFCLQASPEFQTFFTQMVRNEPMRDGTKTIKTAHLSDASHCDLAYITNSEYLNHKIMEQVVIIKDDDYPISINAVFTLFEQRNKLRFEIDTEEARRLHISISSELLKLAKKR